MLESLLLVFSISLDSFLASISYGTSKIKIPFSSNLIIDLVSSSIFAISIFLGSIIKNYLPLSFGKYFSFIILILIGIYRLFDSILKSYIKNKSLPSKPLTFKILDFKFVLDIYADETKADFDKSKVLTAKEAFYLAIVLSADSLAVGFGSSLNYVNHVEVIALSLIIGILTIPLGCYLGGKLISSIKIDISWVSGFILILLAFIKLI